MSDNMRAELCVHPLKNAFTSYSGLSENQLIGGIDVVGYDNGIPVIGYNLSRTYRNHGYMTKACQCLLNYLFSQGYEQVRIDAVTENIGSNRVIRKCGGILVKTEEDFWQFKNQTVLVNRYVIHKKY